MKTIKRVSPKSFAKILAAVYALLGVIGGLVFFIMGLFGYLLHNTGSNIGMLLWGIAAPVCFGILYGILGLVAGFIGAWIYNFAAKQVGGLEIEVQS